MDSPSLAPRSVARRDDWPLNERQTKEVAMIELREPAKDEINHRAYALYLMSGREHGRDVEDWVRVEKELDDDSVGRRAPMSASRLGELRHRWPVRILLSSSFSRRRM